MKISTIAIIAIMLMVTVSTVSAQEWNNFGGGQYVINAKSGNIPIGDNWNVMGIYCLFSMPSSGFTQHFIYAGVNKGYLTPYLGFVGNWRGRDLPYVGTFVDIPLSSSILSSTEFDVMFWVVIRTCIGGRASNTVGRLITIRQPSDYRPRQYVRTSPTRNTDFTCLMRQWPLPLTLATRAGISGAHIVSSSTKSSFYRG